MGAVRQMLDALKAVLEEKTGLPVAYDPQAVRLAEPQIRLTFAGSRPRGRGRRALVFGLSVLAAGDGPGAYLDRLIEASIKVDELFDRCKTADGVAFATADGDRCALFLSPDEPHSGVFALNGTTVSEPEQWTYVYTEARSVVVSIPW